MLVCHPVADSCHCHAVPRAFWRSEGSHLYLARTCTWYARDAASGFCCAWAFALVYS